MTYQVGGLIQASDINSWLTTVNNVWGTGNGDRGYGQTSAQSAVAQGNTVTSTQWMALRYMVNTASSHQGTATTLLPIAGVLDPADIVYAHVNGTAPNDYSFASMVAAIDTNRLAVVGTDMTLSSGVHTVTKATSWTASTSLIVDATFGSEDQCRYFFNTGGEIRIRLSAIGNLAASGASQDVTWRDIITNKVGTVAIKARSSSRTGSAGTTGTLGFYGMTGSATNIFTGTNLGTGAYASNDLNISASVLNVAGVNGGNGTVVRFLIDAQDQHTNANYDLVSAGLTAQFDVYKANQTYLPQAIASPTFTTPQAWT
jgi:hypothetical protein